MTALTIVKFKRNKLRYMKILNYRNLLAHCAGWLLGLSALTSCGTITEELPPCENHVQFRYDMNMLFVDAFPVQVHRVNLYVFDNSGKFVTMLSDEQDAFGGNYRMTLPSLPAGDYRLVAWAGLYDRSYEFGSWLQPGISTPDDIRVKMHREEAGTQAQELDALWHGEARVTLADDRSHTETIHLTKDTNRFRIIVQGETDLALRKDDLDFTITDRNGHLNHDNTPLADAPISYKPYYQADADLSEKTKAGNVSAVVAELNTLRLMEDADARLTVTHKNGERLIDIDLIRYLLLTKMEGHDMPAQEYLDRQDEYAMIFFLNKDALGNYLLMYVKVNGWTIRPQDGDF